MRDARLQARTYSEAHFGERLPDIRGQRFYSALFSDCEIGAIAGAVLKDCVLAGSKITADDPRDLFGATVTLNCFTFDGLQLSPAALDGIVYLLTMTRGNDAARENLRAAIDPERLKLFRRLFPQVE